MSFAYESRWDTRPLKRDTVKIGSGKTPTGGAEAYADSGVTFLRSQNIHFDGLRLDEVAHIDFATHQEMWGTRVQPGDVLLNITGASIGRVSFATIDLGEANVNQHVCIVRLAKGLSTRYFAYSLSSRPVQEQIRQLQVGGNRDGLNFEQVGNLRLPAAPTEEQHRVADFLDAETARIDRLAASRAAQVSVMRERFTALARQQTGRMAIRSKSLSDGWQAVQLRHVISSIKTGGTPPTAGPDAWAHADEPGAIPWYGPSGIHDLLRVGDPAKHIGVSAVTEKIVPRFPSGSILVVGIGATAGKVAYIDHEATGNQQITALVSESSMVGRFLGWQLWAATEEMRELAPYTTLPIINNDFLKSFPVAVPSSENQEEVVHSLDRAASQLNSLELIAQKAAQRLQERRQALITAAVTGQFDVTTASGRNVTDGVSA
ncbi:restriction endonuclease subunit S [Streptomyces sp. NBC_01762]|uniref:restriction endonuclease subunit S n=1 Tax=unclassified Streptomyces TaxID=2593676 RepID=UPI002DDA0013|nr:MULTISPECIES: restriction endonuclease subunit S [unclassified Streptomyces]WSC46478.1 restriction endonuclease subunit S [Streptomyces sp. NBC_01762]WSD26130.1 restriction endonuclease subunit S [Streptomyces sp. NBC_01751]